MLNSLNVPYEDVQVVEGAATQLSPSIIFFIKSPAVMEVEFDGKTYTEEDGVIFVKNAASGKYKLNVKGKEQGKYEVMVGEIGKISDSWNSITGEITSLIPQLETDSYTVDFDENDPDDFFVDVNNPIKLIDELVSDYKELQKVKLLYALKMFRSIRPIMFHLDREIVKKNDFIALEKLENVYGLIMAESSNKPKLLTARLEAIKKQFRRILEKRWKNIDSKRVFLEMINKKLNLAEKYLQDKKYSYMEIVLESIENLIKKL